MEDIQINKEQETNQKNFIYCRTIDLVILMRTKEERINIVKRIVRKYSLLICIYWMMPNLSRFDAIFLL